jgi:hypothetical protein
MKRRIVIALLPCLLCSCGGDEAPAERCELEALGGTLEVSEGGRVSLALSPSAAVTDWSITQADPFVATKVDATHLLLKAPYGHSGPFAIGAAVVCGAVPATATWSVVVRPLAFSPAAVWTETIDGPLNREYGSMWIDDGNPDRLLVFGGFQYVPAQFTTSWDLWELDLAAGTWTELTPTDPPHLAGGRLATAPGTRTALYLGGLADDHSIPPQLSRFSYAPDQLSWADELVAVGTVKPDYQPGLVYDSQRQRFLSVCGVNNGGYHCAVRAYTPGSAGGTWEDLDVAAGPPGRNGHFFAYDEATDRVILFGGDRRSGTLGDTWALELGETPARWVSLGDDPAMQRRNGAFALDPEGHRFFIWGGTPDGAIASPDVWALDLDRGSEQWVQVIIPDRPPDRASGMAVYDAKRQRLVMGFGNSMTGRFADLWALQL